VNMLGMGVRRAEGFFDRWASTYDRSIHQRLMFEPVQKAALDALGAVDASPSDILDVGCGTGRLLEAAARRWGEARLVGIDLSPKMVAEARRKHEADARFTFTQADASALPVETATVDVVLSTMSFHHWADQALGIREVARVLRPDGYFVLADVDAPLLFLLRPVVQWFDHATFRSPDEIEQLLVQAGLSVAVRRRFWRLSRVQLFVAAKRTSSSATAL
jgi:ubiquinone/menaquinone biosynthesis C-methylase UbiE